jgi:deoxyribonuclease-4
MIEKAVRLEVPIFQAFLLSQDTGKLLLLKDHDLRAYLTIRRDYFKHTYVHGSYRINLAGNHDGNHFAFRKEIEMAKKLEFTHMVVHPGSAAGFANKNDGIYMMARSLNQLLAHEHDITIVLENAAHGNAVVGGDLQDFVLLRTLLDHPDKVQYCIDTAHAYAYGYTIESSAACESLIDVIHNTIGLESIALLHVNDTAEDAGSKRDRHAIIGDGKIGQESLKQLVQDSRLAHIPIIMEMPEMQEQQEKNILALVRSWCS